MKHKVLKVFFLLGFGFILASCGATKVTYEKGFPTEESPALTNFLGHYFIGMTEHLLNTDGDRYIYSEENGSFEDREISYFQYTTDQLEQYYNPLFETDDPSKTFHKLFTESEDLPHNVANKSQYNLPDITKEKRNQLSVKTAEAEKDISLSSASKQITKEDKIGFNLVSANKKGFVLHLTKFKTTDEYYLFALQDLSDFVIYGDNELDKAVEKGELEPYYPLLADIGDNYKKLQQGRVINIDKNKVQRVAKEDLMSEDAKYIYVNGREDPLKDGEQQIQRVDDYFADSDEYETAFKISFKKIAKELDLSTSGISKAAVKYFNKDYIVLRLSYNGRIVGKAGATNVMIDLQDKENPTAYLVDLGWE